MPSTRSDESRAIDIPLKLTAIILLLRPLDVWWISPFILLATGLSLLFERVRRQPFTWWILSVLVGLRILAVWPLSDNHIYLLAYWCLAIGLALASRASGSTLAASSRLLIGAAFAFAVLWKGFLAADYRDGRFFRVTLLTDDRFADAVMLLGGMTADEIAESRQYLEPLPEGAELAEPHPLVEPPRFQLLVAVATWGGVALEAMIAVLCLMPVVGKAEILRHATVLLFCATTYAFAPVAGFGWLIATMGLAQCQPDQRILRGAYVCAFFLVLLYSEIPWASVLANWMG